MSDNCPLVKYIHFVVSECLMLLCSYFSYRCIYQLKADEEGLNQPGKNNSIPLNEDVTLINRMLGEFFVIGLKFHYARISNVTLAHEDRKPPGIVTFNLNCDPKAAEKDFLAKVENSDDITKKAFEACKPMDSPGLMILIDPLERNKPMPLLRHVAKLEFDDVMFFPMFSLGDTNQNDFVRQSDDFDLKAQALGKWP